MLGLPLFPEPYHAPSLTGTVSEEPSLAFVGHWPLLLPRKRFIWLFTLITQYSHDSSMPERQKTRLALICLLWGLGRTCRFMMGCWFLLPFQSVLGLLQSVADKNGSESVLEHFSFLVIFNLTPVQCFFFPLKEKIVFEVKKSNYISLA